MKYIITAFFIIALCTITYTQERNIQFNTQLSYFQGNESKVYHSPLLIECNLEFQQPMGRSFSINPMLGISQFKENFKDDDLRWPTQHDGNGMFDPSIPSNEWIIFRKQTLYIDYGLTLNYHPTFLKGFSLGTGILCKSPFYSKRTTNLDNGNGATSTSADITYNNLITVNIRSTIAYQRQLNARWSYGIGINHTRNMSSYYKDTVKESRTFWGLELGVHYAI